jgi:hypothetical protein
MYSQNKCCVFVEIMNNNKPNPILKDNNNKNDRNDDRKPSFVPGEKMNSFVVVNGNIHAGVGHVNTINKKQGLDTIGARNAKERKNGNPEIKAEEAHVKALNWSLESTLQNHNTTAQFNTIRQVQPQNHQKHHQPPKAPALIPQYPRPALQAPQPSQAPQNHQKHHQPQQQKEETKEQKASAKKRKKGLLSAMKNWFRGNKRTDSSQAPNPATQAPTKPAIKAPTPAMQVLQYPQKYHHRYVQHNMYHVPNYAFPVRKHHQTNIKYYSPELLQWIFQQPLYVIRQYYPDIYATYFRYGGGKKHKKSKQNKLKAKKEDHPYARGETNKKTKPKTTKKPNKATKPKTNQKKK